MVAYGDKGLALQCSAQKETLAASAGRHRCSRVDANRLALLEAGRNQFLGEVWMFLKRDFFSTRTPGGAR